MRDDELFRFMVESARDYAIFATDAEGRVVSWNAGAERLFGYADDEIVGRSAAILFTPEDRERGAPERELATAASAGRASDERWHARKDGTRFWASGLVYPLEDDAGLLRGFVKVARDRTEYKRFEAELLRRERALSTLVENLPDVVARFGRDLRCIYVSPSVERALGRPPEFFLGKTHAEMGMPPEMCEAADGALRRIFETGQKVSTEFDMPSPDGPRHYEAYGVPELGPDGRVETVLTVSRDVSKRKQAEAERERLLAEAREANRLKDEFLATVSHELRTPLNAIVGWSGLLLSGVVDEQATRRALETIDRNARAQVQIIEDILDISRIITGRLRLDVRSVDPGAVVETAVDTVRPAADAKGVGLEASVDADARPVLADPDRLQQVVWNLLSNAVKFTPRGGRVRVRVERDGSSVRIVVSDTGPGIPPEFRPYVFDRFRQADSSTTRAHGGLGLGLAIVRHLVELHGGTVSLDSPGDGGGATFTVSLPLAAVESAAARPRERAGDDRASLEGLRVLVVDDEPDARDLLGAVLERAGADVLAVSSAAEALEALERFGPHVLVSDIGMPDEDGYDLIAKVRALPADRGGRVPAVALTAYARAEDRTRAVAAGYHIHVPKPVEPAELVTVVSSLAGRRGEER